MYAHQIWCENMFLIIMPRIVLLNDRKIHVTRKPGYTAWLFLTLFSIIFIGICQRLTKSVLYLIISVFGEIMFALDTFGEWQDFYLNMDENTAVIEKYTWSDKLCFKSAGNTRITMKLTDIRHVGVSIEMGLFVLHKSGKVISLSFKGFSRGELQTLKRDINCFLNITKMESLDKLATNPHKSITPDIANENVNKAIPVSDNTSKNHKTQHRLHQNQSLPSLRFNKEYQTHVNSNLRKGPYTKHRDYALRF